MVCRWFMSSEEIPLGSEWFFKTSVHSQTISESLKVITRICAID